MKQPKESYECEVCGKLSNQESWMKFHEKECKKDLKAREKEADEYQFKTEERLNKAEKYTLQSEPMNLLTKNGFTREAVLVFREWSNFALWDCGTSIGWEEVYDHVRKLLKKIKDENNS